ncbi:MAG TPA: heparan-alpha-glucosaminide N-acetyltransferase domain-containing protein [Puia sp.]|nr:heparan-alpha-glucosaminide N-acetyltransferase domain-containing protein [Puia sp.]
MPPSTQRIRSIDILRGAVMLIMAIDHVRVYSGVPAWSTDYGIFFTRWITNFCAPAFAFFAGTSAFLYGLRLQNNGAPQSTGASSLNSGSSPNIGSSPNSGSSPKSGSSPNPPSSPNATLSRYLLSRGLLLVILELTLIRFFWTFNLNFGDFTLAGIIWMLGWCMVLMSALVWLRPLTVGIAGLFILFAQDLFREVPRLLPAGSRDHFGYFWNFIYPCGHPWSGIAILYVIVPWIGVMMAGYGFGLIMIAEPARRSRICKWIGSAATIAFLVAGTILVLRDRANDIPIIQQLLGQRKYPASQLFLLMTLGPVIFLIPFAGNWNGKLATVMETVGKVPFFYYLVHILAIHLAALVTDYLREGVVNPPWYARAPYVEMEPQHHWPLWLLYLNYFIIVFILYWPCRWYARYKKAHPENKWLRYV